MKKKNINNNNNNNISRRSNTSITVRENRELYNAEAEDAWEMKTNFLQRFLKSYSNSVVELSRREIGWACSCRNLNSMKVITLANLETWQKQQGKHCKRLGWLGIPSKKNLCDLGCFLYPCVCTHIGQSNTLHAWVTLINFQTLQNYPVCIEVISRVFTPLGPHTFAESFNLMPAALVRVRWLYRAIIHSECSWQESHTAPGKAGFPKISVLYYCHSCVK